MEAGIACKWLCAICRGWMRGHNVRISFQDSGDDVYEEVCWKKVLTFEIKLVDVFQRLVDKVETSKGLQKKKNVWELTDFLPLCLFFFKDIHFCLDLDPVQIYQITSQKKILHM